MSNLQYSSYLPENIRNVPVALDDFINGSAKIINKYPLDPLPNSKADQELTTFPDKDLLVDVYSRGTLCFESAADHLMAYSSTLKEPAKTLSPFTCVRSLLESSSIALWLFDINIDARDRVGRCFGYRYKEFTEQIKFLESDIVNSPDAQNKIDKVNQRITVVENKAISLGYPQLLKNGKITGIATRMPETVMLIRKILKNESEYRMLSGVAHCYLWATKQVGFQIIEAEDEQGKKYKALEKHINPEMIFFGNILAVPTLSKVIWAKGKLFGWDIQEIEDLLNQTYYTFRFNSKMRFWIQSN
jgi:hypothetical protein